MAQNPVAIVASVEDVVVMPDTSHIVITLDVGGPKVDLALEPELALSLVDACAKGFAESRDIRTNPEPVIRAIRDTGYYVHDSDLPHGTSQ